MQGLVAGQGGLPAHLLAHNPGIPVWEISGAPADLPADVVPTAFRLEHLGSTFAQMRARGVTRLCFAGAVARPAFDVAQVDAQTRPLLPQMQEALRAPGDAAALRALADLVEGAGFTLCAAQDLAPDLLPPPGPLAGAPSAAQQQDAMRGFAVLRALASADLGQAVVVCGGRVIAIEAAPGTDWMLDSLHGGEAWGGVLVKAPSPDQDLRLDLPTIGPDTLRAAARAGLRGVALPAGRALLLDRAQTISVADQAGIALWIVP